MSEENKIPFGIPIIASGFMPEGKSYMINLDAFAVNINALGMTITMNRLEHDIERLWENFSYSPTIVVMSREMEFELWFMMTFPTLWEAKGYHTPWERLMSKCKTKMEEIESYSSRKASQIEDECECGET
jgi:hypothetical protein